MEIDNHDDARFHGNSKKCDVTHPNGHTEVVAKPILENEPSSHGIKGRKDEDSGFRCGMENHVEEQEYYKEHDGHNDLQARFCPQLEFIFPGPFVGITGRQYELLTQEAVCFRNKSAVVLGREIQVHIACEQPILIANHRDRKSV